MLILKIFFYIFLSEKHFEKQLLSHSQTSPENKKEISTER
jgi:hypothetical protein